jgi:hypothetical protein
MRRSWLTSIALLSVTATVAAEDFDGSTPIDCLPAQGHDCLPGEKTCRPLKPEGGKDLHMHFNIAQKSVRTPYRNATLPIQSVGTNAASLVMQGTSLQLVWSATIHRSTGRLTVAIADREGAYVIFGQCTVEDAALPRTAR